jgi:hypothetical protein
VGGRSVGSPGEPLWRARRDAPVTAP